MLSLQLIALCRQQLTKGDAIMAVTTLNSVADYLLYFAQEHGDVITPLKLQKMVYYADAWYMALNDGAELVPERFEAWVHGPVARDLYVRFADYKWQPITAEIVLPDLPANIVEHLNEIYHVFGGYTAYELEQLTHQEQPWISARGDLAVSAVCTHVLDKKETAEFYRSMMEA